MDSALVAKYEYNKLYKQLHKDMIRLYDREYYSRTKTPITCQCGATILSIKKNVHDKTKKHVRYMSSLTP